MWIVYKTTNELTGKIYIGQHKVRGKSLDTWYLGSGILLKEAISKYGLSNFTRIILAKCDTQKEAYSLEKKYISKFESTKPEIGYNIAKGGVSQGSALQWIKEHDPKRWETIVAKMRINGKNSPSLFKNGHKLSSDSIEKMKSNLPKKRAEMSESTKEKIGNANRGRPSKLKGRKNGPLSSEHRQKLREAKLGKKFTSDHRLKISMSLKKHRRELSRS